VVDLTQSTHGLMVPCTFDCTYGEA